MNSGKYALTCPVALELGVERLLDQLPDRVAVRPDDHAALDRRIVGQLGAADHVEIPLRKSCERGVIFGDERIFLGFLRHQSAFRTLKQHKARERDTKSLSCLRLRARISTT